MYNEKEMMIKHDKLFSGSSLKIGKIHWYILKADSEIEKKRLVKGKAGEIKLTDFGKEVIDEIYWWVFKKETQIEELLNRTSNTLSSVQKLKKDSFSLKRSCYPESYEELISKIKEFTEYHSNEVDALYDYVVWLNKKNILAPSILFTYRVWGSTRLGDRTIKITATTIDDENPEIINITTEIALGLRKGSKYTSDSVYTDISEEIYGSFEPEECPISVPKKELIFQTSREALDELATYFECLRDSLRNILLDIEKYKIQTELLTKESFWRSFITKAMDDIRIEAQLWDFKETFEMWHLRHKDKEKAEIKFCEQVAAFTNARGGVIIVGITDSPPRTIVGIDDLENKSKSAKSVLNRYIKYDGEYIHFQQVMIHNSENKEKNCLVIVVAQTKGVVSVKDQSGKFSYPLRLETGQKRVDRERIGNSKWEWGVLNDNYDFLSTLNEFIEDKDS